MTVTKSDVEHYMPFQMALPHRPEHHTRLAAFESCVRKGPDCGYCCDSRRHHIDRHTFYGAPRRSGSYLLLEMGR